MEQLLAITGLARDMVIPDRPALVFAILAAPICLWVAYSDLRAMRIPNPAVYSLFGLFVLVGPVVLPLGDYLWQLLHMPVLLVLGIAINAARLVGAGDAKFLAAAGPYLWLGDLRALFLIFLTTLLAGFIAHRLARHSPLRRLAPGWRSWSVGTKFPMGFPLAATLMIYLVLGAF